MNLLFDLDGTLTDPALGISRCLAHACERVGAPIPAQEQLARYIGPPLQQSLRQLLNTKDDALVDNAVAAYRERFTTIGLYENTLIEHMPAVLHRLQDSGHRLWVATSKPHVYADRIIDYFDLRPFFLRVYGAELDGTRSGKGELLRHLLDREGLRSSETLMIGDREHDVFGARAVGVRTIAVRWGYGSIDELTAAGPGWLIEHPHELLDLVGKIVAGDDES